MKIEELLTKKKDKIFDRWLGILFDTYPQESATLLKERQDPFSNPVGATFRRELENIFDGITAGVDTKEMVPFLDAIIRIRAVQQFKPSEAIQFTVHLKKTIREELGDLHDNSELASDLSTVESRIDELTLVAFDLYVACREKISAIRTGEALAERDRLLRVVQALGKDLSGPRPGPVDK